MILSSYYDVELEAVPFLQLTSHTMITMPHLYIDNFFNDTYAIVLAKSSSTYLLSKQSVHYKCENLYIDYIDNNNYTIVNLIHRSHNSIPLCNVGQNSDGASLAAGRHPGRPENRVDFQPLAQPHGGSQEERRGDSRRYPRPSI